MNKTSEQLQAEYEEFKLKKVTMNAVAYDKQARNMRRKIRDQKKQEARAAGGSAAVQNTPLVTPGAPPAKKKQRRKRKPKAPAKANTYTKEEAILIMEPFLQDIEKLLGRKRVQFKIGMGGHAFTVDTMIPLILDEEKPYTAEAFIQRFVDKWMKEPYGLAIEYQGAIMIIVLGPVFDDSEIPWE